MGDLSLISTPVLAGEEWTSISAFGVALQGGAFGEETFSVLEGFGSALIASHQNADGYFSLLQDLINAARRKDAASQREILRRIVSGLSEKVFLKARPYVSVRLLGTRRFDSHPERKLAAIFGVSHGRQLQRVDTRGASIVEGGAILMVGARKSPADRTHPDVTELMDIARMSEARGLWQMAHHGYIKALQLYLGMGDVAGARMTYEGAGRMGMTALASFFEKSVAVQIEKGDSKNLRENLLGLAVGLRSATAHLRESEILGIDELFESTLARFIGLSRDFVSYQTAALLCEIAETEDILPAAKQALPELRKLFSLLHSTPKAGALLLLEYAEHQKTVEDADLVFVGETYRAAVEYIETRVPAPVKDSLLATVREAADKMYESAPVRPSRKINDEIRFDERAYWGPHVTPPDRISFSPNKSLSIRLGQAAELEHLGGLENIQRALLLMENRDEDGIAAIEMSGRLHVMRSRELFNRMNEHVVNRKRYGSPNSLITVMEFVRMDFGLAQTLFSNELTLLINQYVKDPDQTMARLVEVAASYYRTFFLGQAMEAFLESRSTFLQVVGEIEQIVGGDEEDRMFVEVNAMLVLLDRFVDGNYAKLASELCQSIADITEKMKDKKFANALMYRVSQTMERLKK